MDFLNHPGNLGSVRGSIYTGLHYDWPAYPEGEDFREALFHLSAFPYGTEFVEIDDGDRCILLVADVTCGKIGEPYHHRNFHICSWHEDLIAMHDRGFIIGVEPVTENAYDCGRWDNILRKDNKNAAKIMAKINGSWEEIPAPVREIDDEDEPRNWLLLPTKRVSVTRAGMDFIANQIRGANVDFAVTLSPTVAKLLNAGFYDTAVREACVTLEHTIKTKLESNKYGDKLTDEFLEYLRDKDVILESSLRTYRQELRTVFKLVRNVYIHNLNTIDESVAVMLLFRISRVKTALEM